jgi:hypothetical protein
MRSWPMLRERMTACTDCQARRFVEVEGRGHPALFQSPEAQAAFSDMLDGE